MDIKELREAIENYKNNKPMEYHSEVVLINVATSVLKVLEMEGIRFFDAEDTEGSHYTNSVNSLIAKGYNQCLREVKEILNG